jgi:hypothetical protein
LDTLGQDLALLGLKDETLGRQIGNQFLEEGHQDETVLLPEAAIVVRFPVDLNPFLLLFPVFEVVVHVYVIIACQFAWLLGLITGQVELTLAFLFFHRRSQFFLEQTSLVRVVGLELVRNEYLLLRPIEMVLLL